MKMKMKAETIKGIGISDLKPVINLCWIHKIHHQNQHQRVAAAEKLRKRINIKNEQHQSADTPKPHTKKNSR